jgi:hypothetical protein
MDLRELMSRTCGLLPIKIGMVSAAPERLAPGEVEKASLAAIESVLPSTNPGASAKLVGGLKFPDITVTLGDETGGVEVKSTRNPNDPWRVPGGSIMEGNRVDGVGEVWVLFTKLAGNIETRAKPYAETIEDISVTHSPRYLLNMELDGGRGGLFDRLRVSYEDVRNAPEPFRIFRNYLEDKAARSGGRPWWSPDEADHGSPALIRFWEDLDPAEKRRLTAEGLALFGCKLLFGSGAEKYKDFAVHLLRGHSILCCSLRDLFSAGGKKELWPGSGHGRTPAVFARFRDLLPDVRAHLKKRAGHGGASWGDWREKIRAEAASHGWREIIDRILLESP